MRRFVLPLSVVLAGAVLASNAPAQPPEMSNPNAAGPAGGGLNNIIQAAPEDINAAYAVTSDAGAWMICAASYQGESATELAYLLCTYLRQQGHPAYVFNRGNEDRRQLQEELDARQRAYPGLPRRRVLAHPTEDQLAVLIGGFKDADAANKQLNKVRKWDLPNIKLRSGKPAVDTFDVYEPEPGKTTYALKRYAINPFHSAFVIPNPLLPIPKASVKVDPLWKKLNAGESRSLYKCPKPWTLAVQEFRGAQVIQTTAQTNSGGFLDKIGFGGNFGKSLDNSAKMAQQVCDMFKKLGFRSYVLHTRTSSIVTVGEFDAPNDPQLQRMQEQLAHLSFKNGLTGQTAFNLFRKAMPMPVPKD
jgi:cell division septation protein DedD